VSFEPVDVYVYDSTPDALPVEGVVVHAYNQAGTLRMGAQVTDVEGKASFLLEAPVIYQARFFKLQVDVRNPQYLSVEESPATNVFTVTGDVAVPPTVADPRLCVAHGIFRRPDGSPAPFVDLHFTPKFKPLLLEGNAVLNNRLSVRTDKDGYVEISLIKCGQYDVVLQGMEDQLRLVSVPETPNVNIAHLLFPRVQTVSAAPEGPYSLAVDEILVLTMTVVASNGLTLDGLATGDVNWASSDPSILSVTLGQGTITLRGVAPGTASLTCTRLDSSIVAIPNTPIAGQPFVVTVV